MPSGLFTLDSDLPNLTGKETPQEQIRKLWNYLVQMRQGLLYALRNLSAENFSTSALQQLTDGAKVEVSEKLDLMQAALSQLSSKVDSISGRVSSVEGLTSRVNELAETDNMLAEEIAGLQEAFWELRGSIVGADGILQRQERAEQILALIALGEDGTVTIGAEGMPLQLVGQVYINGELYGGDAT